MGNPTVFPKLRGGAVQPEQARALDLVDTVVRPVAQALAATPIMGAPPPPWTDADLLSGFVTMAVPGFNPGPAHHVDALRYTHCRGRARNPTAGALTGVPVMRLPVGARPNVFLPFQVVYSLAGATTTILVQPDGLMVTTVAAGENIWWCFSFLAEQ